MGRLLKRWKWKRLQPKAQASKTVSFLIQMTEDVPWLLQFLQHLFMVLMKRGQRSGDWRALLRRSSPANMAVTKAQRSPLTGTYLAPSRVKNGALEWK